MKPAPSFTCYLCQRHIGKERTHWVLSPDRVACGRCVDAWDLYDEVTQHGSRAGIAAALGLWP